VKLYMVPVLSLLLSSCVTTHDIRIDQSKIIGYHFDLEAGKKMEQPYVARFKKGDKELLYVLSKHVSEKEFPNIVDHPTNITIQRLFGKFAPQVVILEGIPPSKDVETRKIQDKLEKCRKHNFKGCGESFFAMDQAIQRKADFISGEPTEKDIQEFVAKSGFTRRDLLGVYMVRQIPQMKRRNEFNSKTFPTDCQRFLNHYRERVGLTAKFDYDDFKQWYQVHMKTPVDFLDIENDDTAPHGGQDATYVQRILHLVGLARDRVIVQRIEEMLNQHDRVLIVYGGSHFLLQERALKDALGEPEYFREVENEIFVK
jgi:hypothetical protein